MCGSGKSRPQPPGVRPSPPRGSHDVLDEGYTRRASDAGRKPTKISFLRASPGFPRRVHREMTSPRSRGPPRSTMEKQPGSLGPLGHDGTLSRRGAANQGHDTCGLHPSHSLVISPRYAMAPDTSAHAAPCTESPALQSSSHLPSDLSDCVRILPGDARCIDPISLVLDQSYGAVDIPSHLSASKAECRIHDQSRGQTVRTLR